MEYANKYEKLKADWNNGDKEKVVDEIRKMSQAETIRFCLYFQYKPFGTMDGGLSDIAGIIERLSLTTQK